MRGAGAREAPPLTITIDAPRIMKIMVFALMDIGRGRAGPERRPPAPAPPRPRPDAEPPPPPQRSARRAPTAAAAGRGGGAGPARGRGRGAPGVLGRPARALAAPAALRSALGPASRPARGAAPAPSPRGLPRARLPGGPSPPAAARPRDAGRTPPPGGPQGPLAPIRPAPALAACPAPLDRAGPRPEQLGRSRRGPRFLPHSSSPLLGWRPLLQARGRGAAGGRVKGRPQREWAVGWPASCQGGHSGARPRDSKETLCGQGQPRPALLGCRPGRSEAQAVALIRLPHDAGGLGSPSPPLILSTTPDPHTGASRLPHGGPEVFQGSGNQEGDQGRAAHPSPGAGPTFFQDPSGQQALGAG